jgi:membrane-associated phospholipid phosphatase
LRLALALAAAALPARAADHISDVFPDHIPDHISDDFGSRISDVFRAGPSDALSLTPADAVIIPAALVVFGGIPLLHLAPAHCRVCDGPDDSGLPGSVGSGRGSLNGVDAFFHDALTGAVVSRKTADTTSTVLAYGVTPAFALGTALFATGPHASSGAGVRAAVIVVESVALAGAATELLKVGFARKRPYVRYGTGTLESPYDISDDESRQGFVSGHTSAVAALGISAALCASLQDSEFAPAAWTAAGTLVALTGTLRMVAEQHYFTDVLAGTAVGAAAGVAVPLLHRNGVHVTGNGFAVSF